MLDVPPAGLWLILLLAAEIGTFLAGRITLGFVDATAAGIWHAAGSTALAGTAAVSCLLRAATIRRDRLAWLALALGIVSYTAGSLITRAAGDPEAAPIAAHLA